MSVKREAAGPTPTGRDGRLRRLTRLLAPAQWTYLLALLFPLAVTDITFKVIRVATQETVPGPLGFLDQIRSDLFINAAMIVFWIGLFALLRRAVARSVLLIVLHVVFIFLMLLTSAGHFYFEKTGSMLDSGTVAMAFQSFAQIKGVIGAEMGSVQWGLMMATFLYGVFGPALITRALHGRWLAVLPRGPRRSRPRLFRASAVAGGTALLLVLLACLPGLTGPSAFSRNNLVSMVMDGVGSQFERTPDGWVPPTRDDIPDHTKFATTPDTKKRNVVMIYLESVRYQSTTLGNPELNTTPFLSELAKSSLVAENAYAVLPHTSKSMTAGHCGVEPPLDTENTEADTNGLAAKCLPSLLKEQGYQSVFFQSATEEFERRRMLVDNFGYDEFHPLEDLPKDGYHPVNYFGYEDDIMLNPSREWAEQHKDKPFLMTYLTVTSHHDYKLPEGFPLERRSDHGALNDYLNTIRYQDRFVERVIQQYKDMGLYDNTVFMIMADHGEGFGEHKLYQHDNTIYNEGIKIPMLVHDPQRFKQGEKVTEPVQNMTAVPTLADLLGFKITDGRYRTTSLLDNKKREPLRVSCFHEDRCLASIDGTKKYIHHFGHREDEYFDLATDPHEEHNLIKDQDKDEMAAIKDDLLRWQATVKATYALKRGSQ